MRSLLLVASLLILSACSGDYYSAASGTLDEATATVRKSDLQSAVALSFVKPSQVPGGFSRTDPYSTCKTSTPETTEDADSDGIKKTLSIKYNCSAVSDTTAAIKLDLVGSIVETDHDDANAAAGYHYEVDLVGGWKSTTRALSSTESYSYKGIFDLKRVGDIYDYKSNFQGVAENTATARAAYTTKSTWGSTWTHKVTPDSTADPKAAGSVTVAGYYGYKTEYTGEPTNKDAYNFVLKVTSDGLKYQGTGCHYYKEGTITFEDASSNKVVMTFACTTITTKYNNTVL